MRGTEEQRGGVSGAAWVALSNISISVTDSFPHPRPGHYPRADGRQSGRRPHPVTKAAHYMKLPLCGAGSAQRPSPRAGMTVAACSRWQPSVAKMQQVASCAHTHARTHTAVK